MRTQAQIEASRRNGAKSNGPKTEDGKTRSSQNAVKHGLSANKFVVLDGESGDDWEIFHQSYFAEIPAARSRRRAPRPRDGRQSLAPATRLVPRNGRNR